MNTAASGCSALGIRERTWPVAVHMSAYDPKADRKRLTESG